MSNAPQQPAARPKLTGTEWVICIIAAIGFLFDTYELLMAPLIVPPALDELLNAKPGTLAYENWNGLLLYVPALVGGAFGLVGGYFTDRFGRRQMLVWSILLYAFSAFAAGFSTSVEMLLILRSTTMIGVCVEFVAAVAWLAELFPDPKQREAVLGYTQVCGSFGGLLVASINHRLTDFAGSLPAIPIGEAGNDVWRYTLISGLIPAIPLILVRPFLPESPAWRLKKAAGTLKRPSFGSLFAPSLVRPTLVTAVLFACTLGTAFGALQYGPRIARGHPSVKDLPKEEQAKAASTIQIYQELGGLAGRLVLAFLLVRMVRRTTVLRMFLFFALISVPLAFLMPTQGYFPWFKWGVFVAGFFTIAQLSFWGNYLPLVYPTHLRGTGESFAANVGGRMVGTFGAMLTAQLGLALAGGTPPPKLATAAAIVGGTICAVAFLVSFWLPEPSRQELPD